MQQEISIGSVSWINSRPNPVWFSGDALSYAPEWVPMTYMGLAATANSKPPDKITDFKAFQNKKDFRALMYCRLGLTIDDATRRITRVQVLDAAHDPGWTPPFSVYSYPLSGLRVWDSNIWGTEWHKGEASPISVVRTEARHPNSAIGSIPANETVLVDGLIKFRAGAHTDNIGVKVVGCPYHVPWVWSEMLLTYDGTKFKLYGRGSIFPTHYWYLNGSKVVTKAQVGDISFPVSRRTILPGVAKVHINLHALNLYSVLNIGAPASGPQASLSREKGRSGAVYRHPFTVSAGKVVTHS